ncbi:FAD-dependent oxidoreductase [Povalibacter sp.]|uniref:FAD-dependent oxidoreductase n=1 Tax=Povalibacter sp. TaxID=1962978 RepID=UPI002F423F6F
MPDHPVTRRDVLASLAAAASVSSATAVTTEPSTRKPSTGSPDIIVIGAGVFGAWTAWHLTKLGKRVLLVDAWGAANALASSGGESRITRTAYGRDALYSRMAWESLTDWQWLSARAGLPIFHPIGVLFFFQRMEPYVQQSLQAHRDLGIPIEALDRAELKRRYPQMVWDDIEVGLFERDRGALMARRAVQTLVREFVAAGGEYRQCAIPPLAASDTLKTLKTSAGESLRADQFVFACGPWLPKLFPQLLGSRIFPTRQAVFFFRPPPGDERFAPTQLPCWADFNDGDIYYGFPTLEARGFKIAHDQHGAPMDPDTAERMTAPAELHDVRTFMQRRFPALADAPVSETRVCQYENSSNGDLLIDRHTQWNNAWLIGAGSGHGFKHGPAVGRYAARRIVGELPDSAIEARFSLASKTQQQHRDVH